MTSPILAVVTTTHARDRARERIKWHRRTLDRMLDRIVYAGLSPDDCSGELHRYLASICSAAERTVRVYGEQVYVFARDQEALVLITVLQLPRTLRSASRRAIKQLLALAA